jgi:uncharacterized protein DUF1579
MTTVRALMTGAAVSLFLAVLCTGGVSRAEKPTAAPPTNAPPPGPPKPPAELDGIKWLEGNWHCDGKAPAGPMGPEHAYKSTMRIKRELDGFWYVGEYEQRKAKDNPMAIKARSFMGFDPVAKKVITFGVDSVGGALQLAGAIEGDKIASEGEGSMGGQKIGFKETFSKTGDRALTWHGEVRVGKDWVIVGDDTCKR